MREIDIKTVEDSIFALILSAQYNIGKDIEETLLRGRETEVLPQAKYVLDMLAENYSIARTEQMPICQDCGMIVLYAEIGQEVHIAGSFEDAVNRAVSRAHREGCLRRSVVCDPLFDRSNTGDGTPAIIKVRLVEGDSIRLVVMAKGFGSENCSGLKMFVPSTPLEDVEDFIVDTAVRAGARSCPPLIIGVGIGGTMDKACELAKTALIRDIRVRHTDSRYSALEQRLLEKINRSGIGPGGLGGKTTALAVNIEKYPTHIAALPVAVNLCCHASRHKERII